MAMPASGSLKEGSSIRCAIVKLSTAVPGSRLMMFVCHTVAGKSSPATQCELSSPGCTMPKVTDLQ